MNSIPSSGTSGSFQCFEEFLSTTYAPPNQREGTFETYIIDQEGNENPQSELNSLTAANEQNPLTHQTPEFDFSQQSTQEISIPRFSPIPSTPNPLSQIAEKIDQLIAVTQLHSLQFQKQIDDLQKRTDEILKKCENMQDQNVQTRTEVRILFDMLSLAMTKSLPTFDLFKYLYEKFLKEKKYNEAWMIWNRASEQELNKPDPKIRIELLFWEANIYFQRKEYEKLANCLQQLASHPPSLFVISFLSWLEERIKDMKQDKTLAKELYKEVKPVFNSMIAKCKASSNDLNTVIFKLYVREALIAFFANDFATSSKKLEDAAAYAQKADPNDFALSLYLRHMICPQRSGNILDKLALYENYFPPILQKEMKDLISLNSSRIEAQAKEKRATDPSQTGKGKRKKT